MFRLKIGRLLLVLLFMMKLSDSAIDVGKDKLDRKNEYSSEGSEGNINFENYDNMEPLSVLKKTERMKIITHKSYELKIYMKKNGSDEKMNKEFVETTSLIAKLLISSVTKFMMNGVQVQPEKVENRTLFLDAEFVAGEPENISVDVIENNNTETIPTTSNSDSETNSKTDSSEEKEKETEKEDAKETEKETEKEEAKETEKETEKEESKENKKEEEKEDGELPITSAQPSVMIPSKVSPELPNADTLGPNNSTENIIDYVTSALMSSTAGVYGSIFNHLVLLLPIIIGLTFI